MPPALWSSIDRVCDVLVVRGARPDRRSPALPDLLLEVPHGATRADDFRSLAAELRGPFPPDLESFFFVNTDVGAPEVARSIAEEYVRREPARTAVVLRCLIPRTFIDCNRLIDSTTRPSSATSQGVTPGIASYLTDADDATLLLARYGAYRGLVERAFDDVCRRGGRGLMVHTYAPRSIDVPVDERIVERLRAAYEPGVIETWPLRPEVDLITTTPDGRRLADAELAERVRAELGREGLTVADSVSYPLHPVTLAASVAERHPGRTLCFEIRRDLLADPFTPFLEMPIPQRRAARFGAAIATALSASRD